MIFMFNVFLFFSIVCFQKPREAGEPGGHIYPGWSRWLPVRQTWLPSLCKSRDPQRQRQLLGEGSRRLEPGCHALYHPRGALSFPWCWARLSVQQNPQGPLQHPRNAHTQGQVPDPLHPAPGTRGAPHLPGDTGASVVYLLGGARGRRRARQSRKGAGADGAWGEHGGGAGAVLQLSKHQAQTDDSATVSSPRSQQSQKNSSVEIIRWTFVIYNKGVSILFPFSTISWKTLSLAWQMASIMSPGDAPPDRGSCRRTCKLQTM